MHQHQVYDTDNHFVIDPITKEIINQSEKMKLMLGDHNSERFTFEIPRYIDGHDMTLCNKIEIHYINIDSKTKESKKNVYIVDDMQLSPNGEDVVIFSWLISANATQLAGTLNFRVTFKCISEPSIIDYQMSTEIFKGITVSDGISNSESVIEEYSDVLEQWKQELNLAGEYAQQIQQNASKIDELNNDLSESRDYVNDVINYEINWNDGGYISKDDGNVYDETGLSYSDYVTVMPGTKLIIANTMTENNEWNAFYDANKTFLSPFSNATGEVIVPDGAVKMRLSKYSTATITIASNIKSYIDDSIENVEANAKLTDDAIAELKGELANIEKPTDEQISTAVREYLLENPPDTGASIDDNSVSQDSTWSSKKIASELNKIEHTLTITLNAIDGGGIHTTVIIENTITGEVIETLDYNNEILYVVLPKYFSYRVTIGDADGYAKPNVNVFTGVMNHDMTISATYQFGVIYGYHVNNNESDPASAVTYLEDAIGFTPAKMNYSTDVFEYGSWENAFFMPKPCMLKRDGTVDYYLDANNYALKENGEPSDIDNEDYDGNAMMEWGRDNKKIWYKIVADADDITSYSVYIADHKEDDNYEAWSFYNKNNELMDHFYTPIYSGSLDASNKLRSLSGQAIMHSKSGTQEISYAKANGDAWNIEVWADKLLMFLLLYLMGKSLDVQKTYGRGHESDSRDGKARLDPTGALDDKGLFYGYNDSTHKVKVFGMEDQWAEQWNRCAGLMLDNGIYKYKMTEGTADGTSTVGYRTTDTNGMLDGGQSPTSNGYVSKFRVVGDILLPDTIAGSSSTYYCDYFYQNQSDVQFALLGGASTYDAYYGFSVRLDRTVADTNWSFGAALSCKPLAKIG